MTRATLLISSVFFVGGNPSLHSDDEDVIERLLPLEKSEFAGVTYHINANMAQVGSIAAFDLR